MDDSVSGRPSTFQQSSGGEGVPGRPSVIRYAGPAGQNSRQVSEPSDIDGNDQARDLQGDDGANDGDQNSQGNLNGADPPPPPPRQDYTRLIEISPVSRKYVKRFRTEGNDYRVRVTMPDQRPDNVMDYFSGVYENILERVLTSIPENHYTGLMMYWSELKDPVYLPFTRRQDISIDAFLKKLDDVIQSNTILSFESPFTVSVTSVAPIEGEGKARARISSRSTACLKEFLKGKKSVVTIDNTDTMCLARSLVVAKSYHDFKSDKISRKQYVKIRRSDRHPQTRAAEELHRKAGVSTDRPCGLEEVKLFQDQLKDFQIVVRGTECMGAIIYEGESESKKELCILFGDSHFDAITKVPEHMCLLA